MKRRFLVTGSATVAALIVLTLALLGGRGVEPRPIHAEGKMKPIVPLADIASAGQADAPIRQMENLQFSRKHPDGRVVVLSAQHYEPRPDGTFDAQHPQARIYLPDGRVVRIGADAGTFWAPDNEPRSGRFRDHVVLDLLGPDTMPSGGSKRLAGRCFIDGDVQFETELGLIETEAFVHLTSPRVEATGWAMRISHSVVDSKLQKFVGFRHGEMRFAPLEPTAPADTTGGGDSSEAPPESAATDPTAATVPDRYLATFDDRVVIRAPDGTIYADRLQVVFSLNGKAQPQLLNELGAARGPRPEVPGGRGRRAAAPERGVRLTRSRAPDRAVSVSGAEPLRAALVSLFLATVTAADGASLTQRVQSRSMLSGGGEPITIQWRGNLTVVPLDPESSIASNLAGPDDVLLSLHGRPLRIETRNDERIVAASMDYLVHDGRLVLAGSAAHPMVIDSRARGVMLDGTQLVVDRKQGTGRVVGPGTLRAHDEPGLVEAIHGDDAWTGEHSRLPAGTTVKWTEALDLTFESGQPAPTGGGLELSALRTVVFRGDVDVSHPMFRVRADRLSIDLDNTTGHETLVSEIVTVGNVIVEVQGEGERFPLQVEADRLTVQLEPQAGGGMQPRGLTAQRAGRPVIARYGTAAIYAGKLLVFFHVAPAGDADGTARSGRSAKRELVRAAGTARIARAPLFADSGALEDETDEPTHEPIPGLRPPRPKPVDTSDGEERTRLTARLLVAEQDVRIEIPDEQTRVMAGRVVVDVAGEQMELFGNTDQMARLDRPDGALVGHYVILGKTTETVRVIGPGRALFYEDPREVLGDKAQGDVPPTPLLDIAWDESMSFDNLLGLGQFVGHVVVHSEVEKDTVRLTAGEVRVEFAETASSEKPSASGESDGTLERLADSTRKLKSLDASRDVAFLLESWADRPGGTLATSLLVKGPTLNFEEAQQQIRVGGPGTMVFVDKRPESLSDKRQRDKVEFSGRGDTAFFWAGGMTLDALHNDMHVREEAVLMHQPSDGQGVMQLDCDRFVADLEATGGLKVWLGGRAPRPRLKIVKADGNVRVRDGNQQVTTDHLTYRASEHVVRLDANAGNLTRAWGSTVAPLAARSVIWHTQTGRFEARQLGPMRVGGR